MLLVFVHINYSLDVSFYNGDERQSVYLLHQFLIGHFIGVDQHSW